MVTRQKATFSLACLALNSLIHSYKKETASEKRAICVSVHHFIELILSSKSLAFSLRFGHLVYQSSNMKKSKHLLLKSYKLSKQEKSMSVQCFSDGI